MMTIDIIGKQVFITPMSAQEARECITAIKGNLESLRLMLLELHSRRGWEALGYNSWEDCAMIEFGKSRSYVFQLLTAAQVEVNLTSNAKSTIVDLEDIPVSQLTALAKLPPEQQAEGLLLAEEIAQAAGKKRNAIHVAQAVKEIKPSIKQALAKPPKTEGTRTTKQKTGWDISPQQLSTTVKGHLIAVHFEHREDGYHFGFKGPEHTISASGFHSEHMRERAFVNSEYLNPGVWANFRAEELYADYQKSLNLDIHRNEYTSEFVNINDDIPEDVAAAPSLASTTNQMLSAAVETCLGEFWTPESLNDRLQGKIYISPTQVRNQWAARLLKAYKDGEVKEAIVLLPLDHQAFVKFSDYALCLLPENLVAVYLGKRIDNFVLSFEELGMVWQGASHFGKNIR